MFGLARRGFKVGWGSHSLAHRYGCSARMLGRAHLERSKGMVGEKLQTMMTGGGQGGVLRVNIILAVSHWLVVEENHWAILGKHQLSHVLWKDMALIEHCISEAIRCPHAIMF